MFWMRNKENSFPMCTFICRPGVNSFLASSDLSYLLITFANNLDPDQDRHSVGPDLDPNSLKQHLYQCS